MGDGIGQVRTLPILLISRIVVPTIALKTLERILSRGHLLLLANSL